MKTTNNEEFEDFKKWCLYYMDKFKMNDWDVYINLKRLEKAVAQSNIKTYGRVVTFSLNDELDTTDRQHSIKSHARHEVCHLLVIELVCLIGAYCTGDEARLAEERLVVKLCNLLKDK